MKNNSTIINFTVILFLLPLIAFAQNKIDKEKTNSNFTKTQSINSVAASGDMINFKNSTGNSIITFTDEGSNVGSIKLPSGTTFTSTANKLYNLGGSLFWNGSPLGTAGSAGGWTHSGTSIYQTTLTDNVGIGTASPLSVLHIKTKNYWGPSEGSGWGDFSINDGTIGLSMGVATAGGGTGDVRLWTKGGTERLIFSNVAHGDILSIENNNVGIGVLSPTTKLDVRAATIDNDAVLSLGNSDLSHQLTIFPGRSTDPNPFIRWKKGDPLRFAVDPGSPTFFTELMRIESNGNVGIGTANPSSLLSVGGSGAADFAIYGETSNGTGRGVYAIATNTGNVINYGGSFEAAGNRGRGVYGYASATGDVTNNGGYFQAAGNFGRGIYAIATYTGNVVNYGGYFEAAGNGGRGVYGKSTGGLGYGVYGEGNYGGKFIATGTTGRGVLATADGAYGIGVFGLSSGSSGKGVVGDGFAYDFDATGVGVNYGATSSIRWKRNIVEINNPLEKLSKLRGVYFDWDEEHGSSHDVGCIAEEVGKVLPEIVVYEENGIDADGMDYSKLTPLLIEVAKAQQSLIKELKEEIIKIKEKINTYKFSKANMTN